MPGGRLTHQERRHIARGLADGLGYAEIARRLERPTSTVSREVSRNGGRSGYRADPAQREADRRARRGGTAAARSTAGTRERPGAPAGERGVHAARRREARTTRRGDARAVRDFEGEFVRALTASGMTRMAARVLARLYAADGPGLTAADLVRALGVSPASVSLAVGFLEEQGLLRRVRGGRGRRDLYAVDQDIWYRSVRASIRANLAISEAARRGALELGPDTVPGLRLSSTAEFLDRIGEALAGAADELRPLLVPGTAGATEIPESPTAPEPSKPQGPSESSETSKSADPAERTDPADP
ncbi:MarR family transcriptional regulator [Nocardiopsis changdeensis]|uniref:Helix-turn-helix domain-containing protein n=1 Tax=Nocardiopsis changdeensis TaxID=2831969 RepID=A0ABX8BMS3_9ACTN|nr:helix-turn-helix domain-containing protein [Nocardiopsis changdeensis]QYX39484.1 helix-turn-helix domain-containing protein [Nocardiopsis sp. MT53]